MWSLNMRLRTYFRFFHICLLFYLLFRSRNNFFNWCIISLHIKHTHLYIFLDIISSLSLFCLYFIFLLSLHLSINFSMSTGTEKLFQYLVILLYENFNFFLTLFYRPYMLCQRSWKNAIITMLLQGLLLYGSKKHLQIWVRLRTLRCESFTISAKYLYAGK